MEYCFDINSDSPVMLEYLFNGWIQLTCDSECAVALELKNVESVLVYNGFNWDHTNGKPESELVLGPRRFWSSWFQDEPKIFMPKKSYRQPYIDIVMKSGKIYNIKMFSNAAGLQLGSEILSAVSGRTVIVPTVPLQENES